MKIDQLGKVLVGAIAAACLVLGACTSEKGSESSAKRGMEANMASVSTGMQVSLEYTLRVDGDVFDSNVGGTPLVFVQGTGQIIPGLEKELVGMTAGESKHVTVSPEEGYGPLNPNAFVKITREQLPQDGEPEVGQLLQGTDPQGQPFQAKIHEISDEDVMLDLNHPLAGKTLNFEVKVISVVAQS